MHLADIREWMMVHLHHSLTPMGEHLSTNFSNWDLAVPGSPNINKLISPLRVRPSGNLTKSHFEQIRKVVKKTKKTMWSWGSFCVVSPLPGAPKQKARYGLLQVITSIDGRGERASEGVIDGWRGSQSPQLLFLLRGDWTSGSTAWKTVRRTWEWLKRLFSTQDKRFS